MLKRNGWPYFAKARGYEESASRVIEAPGIGDNALVICRFAADGLRFDHSRFLHLRATAQLPHLERRLPHPSREPNTGHKSTDRFFQDQPARRYWAAN